MIESSISTWENFHFRSSPKVRFFILHSTTTQKQNINLTKNYVENLCDSSLTETQKLHNKNNWNMPQFKMSAISLYLLYVPTSTFKHY